MPAARVAGVHSTPSVARHTRPRPRARGELIGTDGSQMYQLVLRCILLAELHDAHAPGVEVCLEEMCMPALLDGCAASASISGFSRVQCPLCALAMVVKAKVRRDRAVQLLDRSRHDCVDAMVAA